MATNPNVPKIFRTYRPSNVPEFYLQAIPNPENVYSILPFSYVFPQVIASPSTLTVQTFSESDFLCNSLQVDGAPGALQVVLRELTLNWPLMSAPTPISSIFGSASLPYYLPVPWFISNKTTIEAAITGVFGVAVTLTLSGMRVFRRS